MRHAHLVRNVRKKKTKQKAKVLTWCKFVGKESKVAEPERTQNPAEKLQQTRRVVHK